MKNEQIARKKNYRRKSKEIRGEIEKMDFDEVKKNSITTKQMLLISKKNT